MKQKIVSIPSKVGCSEAELAGFFAADGSMQRAHICFWGNPEEDKDYYDYHLKNLIKKSFGIIVRPHLKLSNSVYGFYLCNPQIIRFFHNELGFNYGSKTYDVKVPKPIISNPKFYPPFLRGFMSGDGCLNFDKRYGSYQKLFKVIHTYPRIFLRSVSTNIIIQMSAMLNQLNIGHFVSEKHSKRNNEATAYVIQISGVNRLIKWYNTVGFANSNHSSRYEIFKNHGFVPSNTTYKQRLAILEGKLNPWSFYPKWASSLAWIGRQKKV
ncbi:MAG: hypothetical protein ABIJ34_06330 [archaeon]